MQYMPPNAPVDMENYSARARAARSKGGTRFRRVPLVLLPFVLLIWVIARLTRGVYRLFRRA